jgi:peptidyl-Lys metalloendopeptidase
MGRMKKYFAGFCAAAICLLAAAACGAPEPAPPSDAAEPKPPVYQSDKPLFTPPPEVPTTVLPDRALSCDLQAKPAYQQGESVELAFKLTNTGDVPLWVLRWNTPIEGLVGDCFEIARNKEVVIFQGRMIKRAMPEATEYVRIDPGQSREAKVDLRAVYKVEEPGKYELRFDSVLFDVTDDETQVPRRLDEFQSFDPGCPEVVFEVR